MAFNAAVFPLAENTQVGKTVPCNGRAVGVLRTGGSCAEDGEVGLGGPLLGLDPTGNGSGSAVPPVNLDLDAPLGHLVKPRFAVISAR